MEETYYSISFSELFKILKKNILWLIAIPLITGGIGLGYAFTIKEEFISEGKILPEVNSKAGGLGQFGGLAALAGIDISSNSGGTDAIRADLYPDILKSTPFFLSTFQTNVKDRNGKSMPFSKFYTDKILDGKLKKDDLNLKFANSPYYIVNSVQTEKNIKNLKQRIVCTFDKKTGVISLSVKMPDPVVAAQMAKYSMDYLTDYIIDYRTSKLKKDAHFLAERLSTAKGKYYQTQEKKASYSDRMPSGALVFQAPDLQRERIDAEYKISSNFYNTLLQKYEEAKLKVQQETPVIKVLEPPVVPNFKSEPKKSIILLTWAFFGLFVSLLFIVLKNNSWKKIFIKQPL